ncbi:C-reactive protein-like, partial [Bolinopsis microptera]|uniref:C-reactive protein-like n=1 Tax=Bolinopsis microptera TaxID=2820187 RepID=UPI00307A4081
MLLLFVLTIFLVFPVTETVDGKYTALQFGTTFSDYISFNHDMSPFHTSLTLCSWVKRVSTSSSFPTVFHYQTSSSTYEILITSYGEYNRILYDRVLDNLQSKFTTPAGQWFHYCLTWSSSSRTTQLYLDGELAASGQTSSGRELYTSGTVWFDRFGNQDSNGVVFRGQLYRFNMYTEVLSSETIKRIADGGLCAEVETISSRQLRWEDVLAKSRSGSVVEVTGCDITEYREFMESRLNEKEVQLKAMRVELAAVTSKLNTTEGDLVTVTGKFNSTKDELQNVTGRLNRTEDDLETMTRQLNSTKDELQNVTGRLNRTEDDLETMTRQLNSTKDELQNVTGRLNRTEDE